LAIRSISTGKGRASKKVVYDALFLYKVKHPFAICFIAIAIFWLIWFYYTAPNTLALLEKNWPVSLTMVFGSFIAGATSEGGGAIETVKVFNKNIKNSPKITISY
jgi:hypothetical protein